MFGSILKKKRKTLVIADDGDGIWGVIADDGGISTEHHFSAGTELKKILEFGREQNAGHVLCLKSADVQELDVKLGTDLSDGERRAAIEYAAASSLGDHSGSQRISYMDGMFHDFRSGILASGFDCEDIVFHCNLARSMKMHFLGTTNFKQLLLASHFSDLDHHGDAFLFFLGGHGLAAIPERGRLQIRNLPFGIPENGGDGEWRERVQRRLSGMFRGRRVCFYAPCSDEGLCTVLQELSGAECVELMNWHEAVAEGAVFFLSDGYQLIHPALPPPKAKDPKAAGTYAAFLFLGLTICSLGFLIGRNCMTKHILEKEIEKEKGIIDMVKRERDSLASLEKQLLNQQNIYFVMKRKHRVSPDFLLVVNLLGRYSLQYSRITSVTEKSTGIYMEGESVWQPDLSSFFTHFEGELSKYKLSLFSDGLSKDKDGRIIFRSHVAPSGGRK